MTEISPNVTTDKRKPNQESFFTFLGLTLTKLWWYSHKKDNYYSRYIKMLINGNFIRVRLKYKKRLLLRCMHHFKSGFNLQYGPYAHFGY